MDIAIAGILLVRSSLAIVKLLARTGSIYQLLIVVVVHIFAIHILCLLSLCIHRNAIGICSVGWVFSLPCSKVGIGFIPCRIVTGYRISLQSFTILIPGPVTCAGSITLVYIWQFLHEGSIVTQVALLEAMQGIDGWHIAGSGSLDRILGTTQIVVVVAAPFCTTRCGVVSCGEIILYIPEELCIVIARTIGLPEVGKRGSQFSAGNYLIGKRSSLGKVILLAEIPGCREIGLGEDSLGCFLTDAAAPLVAVDASSTFLPMTSSSSLMM